MGVEEEADLGGKSVNIEPGCDGLFDVLDRVGEGEGDLLDSGAAGLADVVAADGNRIPTGHVAGAVAEEVGHQAHGGLGGEDVGTAGDILLEDVVLDGTAQHIWRDALLFGDGDYHSQQDSGGSVDGHADAHPVQGNVLKEGAHIVQAANGDADFSDLAKGEVMVGIVAYLGGEVESDGEPGLPLFQEEMVAAVALFGGAEAGVLAHGPEATAVHVGLDAAGERILAGEAELVLVVVAAFTVCSDVGWRIKGLDGD